MTKPALVVFVGDIHTLSQSGLSIPNWPIPSQDNRKYSASAFQVRMWGWWKHFYNRIKTEAKGHRLIVHISGESIDGPNHHGTTYTQGNRSDARLMAVDLLQPLVSLADESRGVLSTEPSHTDAEAADDRTVFGLLDVPHQYTWELTLDGKRLWWTHKGAGVGGREWLLDSAMALSCVDAAMHCAVRGIRRPDLIVSHHFHRAPDPVTRRGVTYAICPCWQGSTSFGASLGNLTPFKHTDIGGILWWPGKDLEIVRYV